MLRDSGMEESRHPKIAELRKFMLNRPSKAVLAPVAEGFGALAAALSKPFVPRDVGYVQVESGQKSRKVRNLMLQSPFKSMVARTAIFALVLALAISFATVGLAPSASAQQGDAPSCVADTAAKTVTCSYDEGDTVPVATFSAPDPEGQSVEWELNGDDAGKFTIDGGVLAFKNSPNYEDATNTDKKFDVTVRATEVLGANDAGPANFSEFMVTVNIVDVDDPGKVTFDYKQPEAGAAWKATFKDEDSGANTGASYEWSVPKVSRPAIDNDAHWTVAAGPGAATQTYTPDTSVVGQVIRVKVTYDDVHGDDKKVYAKTDTAVRATPTGAIRPAFTGANASRTVNETATSGTHVGNPATATTGTDLTLFTYKLVASQTDATTAYAGPFSIDAKTGQIKVSGTLADADSTTPPTGSGNHNLTGDGAPWVYTVYVVARNPSGTENNESTEPGTGETDYRPFPVTITVREVNEKPVVAVQTYLPTRDADASEATPATDFDEDRMIDENHPLENVTKDHDNDADTPERIETPASVFFKKDTTKTISNDDWITVYTFVATDVDADDASTFQDIPAAGAGSNAKRVKLSLAGDDMADFKLFEVKNDASDPADGDFEDTGDTRGRYELRFKAKPNFEAPADANKDNRYEVSVVVTDDEGLSSMKALTIRVENEIEAGTVKLSPNQPAVGFPVTASLTDVDGGVTGLKWQWRSSSTSDGTFTIIPGATSDTYTPKAAVVDDPATTNVDETDPGDEGMFLKAIVKYTDNASLKDNPDTLADESEQTSEKVSEYAVRVEPNVNSDPVFASGITRNVAENTKVGGTVGGPVKADDPDGDTLTYTITGGADEKAFTIDPDGQIKVGKGTELNYEGSQTTYTIEVTATDPFDASDSTTVTIMVTDLNEGPNLGLAAQQSTGPSCVADTAAKTVTCSYDERLTVSAASFSAPDPEGQSVEWELNGDDAGKFTIDGGVLAFKNSPNYEDATNTDKKFDVTVRATEVLGANDAGPANFSEFMVTVNIVDVDDPGKVTFDYKQPEAGAAWKATFKDEDSGANTGASYEWSVPKVSRPAIDNDAHWTVAAGPGAATQTYTPDTSVVGQVIRVKVTYDDVHGDDKKVYAKTDTAVRATPTGAIRPAFTGANASRTVNETATSGTHVGNPATATTGTDLTLFTYKLVASQTDATTAYAGPFSIDAKTGQIKVSGTLADADSTTPPTGSGNHNLSGNGDPWVYTVYVVARNPSGTENNESTEPGTGETDYRPFPVTITVREVNEKPVVAVQTYLPTRDADASEATPATDFDEDRMIDENHPLENVTKDHDNDADTPERIETPASVFFKKDATKTIDDDDWITVYTFVATDVDADDASTFQDIPASGDGSNAKRVKLSLAGDDMADFKLFEVKNDASDPADGDFEDTGDTRGRYELRFKAKPNFEAPADANKDNRYEVSVVVTDDEGLSSMKALTIRVENEIEAGTVKLSPNQPAVGFPVTASLTDVDGGVTGLKWQWRSSSTSGGTFTIIPGATSDTYTPKAAVVDDPATTNVDETDPGDEGMFLKAIVKYTDNASLKDNPDTLADESEQTSEKVSEYAVRVEPNVNSDPVFASGITRNVAENTKVGGTVGGPVKADDPDGDTLTYTITGGADEKAFTIDPDGQIKVGKGTELDYEGSQTTYTIEVTATDPFDASDSTTVTIMVTDLNEGPNLGLGTGTTPPSPGVVGGRATVSVQEGTTAVGTYTAPTAITNATWNLSGTDAGDFSISSGGVLSFRTAPDFENPADANRDNVYNVTVVASNGGGTSASLAVTVTVTDVPDDAFDPLTYDADSSGAIERSEVIQAIRDYFADTISQADVRAVIRSYFSS